MLEGGCRENSQQTFTFWLNDLHPDPLFFPDKLWCLHYTLVITWSQRPYSGLLAKLLDWMLFYPVEI